MADYIQYHEYAKKDGKITKTWMVTITVPQNLKNHFKKHKLTKTLKAKTEEQAILEGKPIIENFLNQIKEANTTFYNVSFDLPISEEELTTLKNKINKLFPESLNLKFLRRRKV